MPIVVARRSGERAAANIGRGMQGSQSVRSQSSAQAFSPNRKGTPPARGSIVLAFLGLLAACFPAAGTARAATVESRSQMIVADNPLAAEAGQNILRAGGTATDAAIAALLVLGLVEPEAAGIGGGAFLLHYSAESRRVDAYDGRETAPAGANGRLFLDGDGSPLDYEKAAVGGRAVGVPGVLRLAKLAHQDHGRLPWSALFEPAIALAEQGFPVSSRLHDAVADDKHLLAGSAAAYLTRRGGRAVGSGEQLRSPAYAESLRRIAAGGPTAFYGGALAQNMLAAIRGDRENPGVMTLQDLERYRAKRRLAICVPYRAWRICGAPPPTSGGLGVLQAMAILDRFDLAGLPPKDPAARRLMAEAERLALADRALFLADPDYVEVPLQQLLDPAYLQRRAALIASDGEPDAAAAGVAAMPDQPEPAVGTQLSVVDQWGNAVALTASIGSPFGSGLMVDGFLLDNALADFAFTPSVAGLPVANRAEGGKRPRSSMAPTMVLDPQGRLVLTVGAAGGAPAIGAVVRALVGVLDWGFDPADAISAAGAASGLNVIGRSGDSWVGAADPRRHGVALAD